MNQGSKEARKQGSKEARKQGSKEARKQGSKEARKQGSKEARKQGSKEARNPGRKQCLQLPALQVWSCCSAGSCCPLPLELLQPQWKWKLETTSARPLVLTCLFANS